MITMTTLHHRLRVLLLPPVLLVIFLLFDLLASWPAITDLRSLLALSLSLCLAVGIGLLSLYLVITGLRQLVRHQTTFNALHADKTTTLLTKGCYAFTRNPVYLGFVGLHLSAAILLGSIAGVLATPVLIALISVLHIQVEEPAMHRLFGREWETYSNKTGRWL
ncbi:isoprenylcysteine carboxylmethyltransferase family protein [Kosakonia sp. ML.JS2a]|uniref:methyltransferase family protein n=1 Tax=Kosakonia sp. ML.JS2a TaxID=2980557 RepID=UPI0021DB148D|nr:isoprenylcysteine carboxylmethyltransferase family protein [Kosakonia sp. ML.JS2a]UXY13048.1 isoprenylcysteine carboxylmethyltransferase family protein [Kosakonia sp. ML.JS2a]